MNWVLCCTAVSTSAQISKEKLRAVKTSVVKPCRVRRLGLLSWDNSSRIQEEDPYTFLNVNTELEDGSAGGLKVHFGELQRFPARLSASRDAVLWMYCAWWLAMFHCFCASKLIYDFSFESWIYLASGVCLQLTKVAWMKWLGGWIANWWGVQVNWVF